MHLFDTFSAVTVQAMRKLKYLMMMMLMSGIMQACGDNKSGQGSSETDAPGLVRTYRDDGTLSSINQVDEQGYVHGVKVNYYEDGRTIHSKVTYQNGRKHGPAIWYFKNGSVYEHTQYYFGRKNGLTRRYYETGELMEEVTYESGEELPGKKRYSREGTPIQ